MTQRRVKETGISKGVNEAVAYHVVVHKTWGTPSTVNSVTAYEVSGETLTDVSESVLIGSASISGTEILLPHMAGELNKSYRIDVNFTTSEGNTLEGYLFLVVDR